LAKFVLRPGEMASQIRFVPQAIVWRTWYRLWRGVV